VRHQRHTMPVGNLGSIASGTGAWLSPVRGHAATPNGFVHRVALLTLQPGASSPHSAGIGLRYEGWRA
jgi:hypothetical protein